MKAVFFIFIVMISISSYSQKLAVEYDTQLIYPVGNAKSYTGTLYIYSADYSVFELDRTSNSGMVEGELYGQRFQYPATKFKHKEYLIKYLNKDYHSYIRITDRNKNIKTYKNNEPIQWQEIKDTLQPIDWQLLPEKKNILGFNCQLARGYFKGAEYLAWFTTDIPFMDGPWKFNGLPGLILEVQSKILDIHIFATSIKNMVPSFKPDIPNYEAYEIISWKDYVARELKLAKEKKEKSRVINEHTNVVNYGNEYYIFFDIKYKL